MKPIPMTRCPTPTPAADTYMPHEPRQPRLALSKLATALLFATSACAVSAANCVPDANGSYLPGNTSPSCDNIPASAGQVTMGPNAGYFALTRSTLHGLLTIGDQNLIAAVNGGFGAIGNQYAVGSSGARIQAGNFTLDVKGNGNMGQIGSHSGVDLSAKTVALTVNDAYSGTNFSGGVGAYGVLTGSTVDSGEGGTPSNDPSKQVLNGTFTTVSLDKLTLNQTTSGGFIPILNAGLRAIQGAYQDAGNGSSGKIVVNGLLDMTLKGGRLEGIYVSGSATGTNGEAISQVQLADSTITLVQSSATDNQSSAIKIGKARTTGKGKGLVISNGSLTIDASKAVGDAIKIYESGSSLQANGAASKSNILANKSALAIGPADWQVAGNQPGAGNNAALGMAKLRTVSTTASLIKVYDKQTAATLLFDRGSDLLAPTDGYWLEMGAGGDLTTTLNQGSVATGLVTSASSSVINLRNASVWTLAEKASGDTLTSTLTSLAMSGGSTLNAFKPGNAGFVVKGAVNSDASTINLQDDEPLDVLTIVGNYTSAATKLATVNALKAGTPASLNIDTCLGDSAAPSDQLVVNGDTAGLTALAVKPSAGASCQGALTTGNGILVVKVTGASNGSFVLPSGPITQGSYVYDLLQVGNDWYLQSKAAAVSGAVVVSKTVSVPAGVLPYNGAVAFSLTCTNPANVFSGSIAVVNSQGAAAPITVPAGSECTVSETLPTLPTGSSWGAPVYVQPAGPMPSGGNQTASITNILNGGGGGRDGDENLRKIPVNSGWALSLLSLLMLAPWGVRRYRNKQRTH